MTEKRYLHRKPPDKDDEDAKSSADRNGGGAERARSDPSRAAALRGPGGAKRAPQQGRPANAPEAQAKPRPKPKHDYLPQHFVILGVLVVVGLVLRLRDPLSTAVIGAEDPYLHMERTWDLLQGHGVDDYPIGFMILLAPFAVAGEQVFYYVVRFLPAFFGAAAVVTTFFLCRPFLRPAGALTAATLVAVMPEHIMRTTLMFPTALDLVLLPVLALAVLRIPDGVAWSYWTAGTIAVVLLLVHPWAVGLLLPVVGTYLLLSFLRRGDHARVATGASVAGAVVLVGVLWLLPVWTPVDLAPEAGSTARQLLADPSSAEAAQHVDLPWMLTWPGLILAAVGLGIAAWRRTDFAILAALWTVMLLPIVLVDWFGIWYLPHRTVAFLSVGVVMLAGLAVSEGIRFARDADVNLPRATYVGVLAVVFLFAIPTAAAMGGWYRLYDEDDYEAWHAIDARDPSLVVTGSWQARAGYRGLTAQEAVFNVQFFHDQNTRDHEVGQHPDLIVLLDAYAIEENHVPTDFLQDWELVGEWGDTKAYQKPNGDETT